MVKPITEIDSSEIDKSQAVNLAISGKFNPLQVNTKLRVIYHLIHWARYARWSIVIHDIALCQVYNGQPASRTYPVLVKTNSIN